MQTQIVKNYVRASLPTILLVEDFDDTRLMMKMWLVKNGYHVIEAETGEEAIDAARRALPDLIIMALTLRNEYASIRHCAGRQSLRFLLTVPTSIVPLQSKQDAMNMCRHRLSQALSPN